MDRFPSTGALQAFQAAAECLSFQQAAQSLNVTPGAVSRQIQAFERSLGRTLFERHHKRVVLSETGRQLLADLRGPLESISLALARARHGAHPGTLSVLAYPTFAIRWFMPRWGRFHDLHPDITLRLTTSFEAVDFSQGQYDVALAIAPRGRAADRLIGHDLIAIDTFPVCAPALAKSLRRTADLQAATLLHAAPRPDDWQRWLEVAEAASIETAKGLQFETLTLAYQAAIEGLGVAIGIGAFVAQDLREGRLVRPFKPVRRSRQPIRLLYPANRAEDPRIRAFRDWLIAEVATPDRETARRPRGSGPRRAPSRRSSRS